MAQQGSRHASAARIPALLGAGLDTLDFGFAIFDRDLRLTASNAAFRTLRGYPAALCKPGTPLIAFYRYNAERGDYGAGDVDVHATTRLERVRKREPHELEYKAASGQILRVRYVPIADDGLVLTYADITARKQAEEQVAQKEAELQVALDNVPGALVFTDDDARIVLCNPRFADMYALPRELLQRGRSYVEVLRYLAQNGYYGDGNVDEHVATIFFSDIAGFTETTDLLESEELTSLLNQYLREMSAIALEYGATIDKFIGDAIMLFFGDPESRGVREDAIACVRMAIAMQQRMRDLQAEWRERGQEHVFQLRIGINTGYCTVGNFGSDERIDYTVIGNEVNLAARLQTHADLGGILLAHETYALVKDEVITEETGTITVKGFSKPVHTHRVVGLHDHAASQGRIIRQEQDGFLLMVDQRRLTDQARADAIRVLQETAARLASDAGFPVDAPSAPIDDAARRATSTALSLPHVDGSA